MKNKIKIKFTKVSVKFFFPATERGVSLDIQCWSSYNYTQVVSVEIMSRKDLFSSMLREADLIWRQ